MSVLPATLLTHGTLDYSELRTLGLRPEELTYFSSNINPFGPPPATVSALQEASTADKASKLKAVLATTPQDDGLDQLLQSRLVGHTVRIMLDLRQ